MKPWIDQNIENNIPTAFFVALIIIYSNKNPFNHCYLCFWIVLIPRRMSYLFWGSFRYCLVQRRGIAIYIGEFLLEGMVTKSGK